MISGKDSYKDAFAKSLVDFTRAVDALAGLTSDNPEQQKRIASLRNHSADYKSNTPDVQFKLSADPATRHLAQQMMIDGVTKPIIDAVNADISQIREAEETLFVTRRSATENSFTMTFLTLALEPGSQRSSPWPWDGFSPVRLCGPLLR